MKTRSKMIKFKSISLLITLAILLLPGNSFASHLVTHIDKTIKEIKSQYGVQVHFKYNREEYFPQKWFKPPISAKGKQVPMIEVQRVLPIIIKFLDYYPQAVIRENLTDIFLLEELEFYGKSFGASNGKSGLYIKSQGPLRGYTSDFLQSRLFSEFSSILYRNYKFPKAEWESVNSNNFKYLRAGRKMLGRECYLLTVKGCIRNLYGQTEELLRMGFLVRYSQSTLENDFNMMTDWMFTKRSKLNKLCAKYPKVKAKRLIAEKFYRTIDKNFKVYKN